MAVTKLIMFFLLFNSLNVCQDKQKANRYNYSRIERLSNQRSRTETNCSSKQTVVWKILVSRDKCFVLKPTIKITFIPVRKVIVKRSACYLSMERKTVRPKVILVPASLVITQFPGFTVTGHPWHVFINIHLYACCKYKSSQISCILIDFGKRFGCELGSNGVRFNK